MRYPRNEKLLPLARQMRKNMTKEERKLWYDCLRYCEPRFRRQEIIGNYIVDFFCYDAALVIELDGSQHFDHAGIVHDSLRSDFFRSLGISVLRYSNTEINQNFHGVCDHIRQAMNVIGIQQTYHFPD